MPENVSIAYRGANYAIGQGPQFYGIWHAAALQSPPMEWWPLTPEGWSGAWSRFASIEVAGTIAPVTQQPVTQQSVPQPPVTQLPATQQPMMLGAGAEALGIPAAEAEANPARVTRTSRIAAAVVGLGVVLGIVGLFPNYVAGASLASQPSDLVAHAIYLAAWTLSAVLIVLGGTRLRVGALMGLGVSAVTFGLFFSDVGTPIADGAKFMGAGLVLGILGWLACTAGVGLALRTGLSGRAPQDGNGAVAGRRLPSRLGGLSSQEIVPLVTLVLAAVGAAIAFAPSWDRFVLRTASGVSQVITEGNAFANPAPVMAGSILVMVALVAVVIVAALWRPMRLGAALAAGAVIPMVAQAISAIVQINGATSPLQFGISQAQANQIGLTITTGLTAMFWVFCVFLGTLILLCAWMLLAHQSPASQQASPYQVGPTSVAPVAVAGAGAAAVAGAGSGAGAADYTDPARLQTGSQ
ncbi:MAG TPA: hypothetical protein VGH96_22655 [Streptosporangiaceae bacterium]